MVLDSRIQIVKDFYGIQSLDDWRKLAPADITALDGVGRVTLDHVRLYLAGQGSTLKDDRTPEHWAEHLGHIKLGAQLHDKDRHVVCPFTVLIDSAEQQPFGFQGLRADADLDHRPLVVPTEWRSLGRFPDSLGDYSIDGYVGRVHVERKSVGDYQGTILGFGYGGRERFERELYNLACVIADGGAAMVVVEGSFADVLAVRSRANGKPVKVQAKIINRSTLALLQDFAVPIHFAGSRRHAEIATFRFLERFWRKDQERRKDAERMLEAI